jgi:hypothetical protein
MKSFKILAIAGALITSGALLSTTATANTYSTTIDITDLASNLAWSETTGMQFPVLLLDGLTLTGHDCTTNNGDPRYNELCPGSRTDVSNSIFNVTGLAGAEVGIQLDSTPQIIEGIQFVAFDSVNSLVLNASGTATHLVAGQLILKDRAAITSNSITFSYNLEFTAQ